MDERYKDKLGQGKESGRKIYRQDPLLTFADSRRKKSMKAAEDESAFRHSDNIKPYQDGGDYASMENDFPFFPPGPPGPWPPLPPIPPQPPSPPNPPVTPDVYNDEFRCEEQGCYCPGQKKCFSLLCTQQVIAVATIGGPGASREGGTVCITAPAGQSGDIALEVTMRITRTLKNGTVYTNTVKQTYTIEKCEQNKCCECGGESIGYTTQSMTTNQTQTLTVVGAKTGCTYTWSTTSGSVNPATGTSTTFTAPSSNANCTNNATITLSCQGSSVASLAIAVTAGGMAGMIAYWADYECHTEYGCTEGVDLWFCGLVPPYYMKISSATCGIISQAVMSCVDGVLNLHSGAYCGAGGSMGGCGPAGDPNPCENYFRPWCQARGNDTCASISPCPSVDKRTASMIASGCCPAGLL